MIASARRAYPTDLTDQQWTLVQPLIPPAKHGGRPREVNVREVLNTLFYQNRTGCQWDMLPHDLLPKSTVYDYFRQWTKDGTWQRILDALRGMVRMQAGREETPSAGSIDSQTVKTTEMGGEVGYDGAKKIKGRKRHVFVDVLGLILAVVVTSAAVDDAAAAPRVFEQLTKAKFPRLSKIWTDSKYHNHKLYAWIKRHRGHWNMEVVSRPKGTAGFVQLPKRWVAERTFAWLGRCRRLSKDYERYPENSESMVRISAIHLMLRRIAPSAKPQQFHYKSAA